MEQRIFSFGFATIISHSPLLQAIPLQPRSLQRGLKRGGLQLKLCFGARLKVCGWTGIWTRWNISMDSMPRRLSLSAGGVVLPISLDTRGSTQGVFSMRDLMMGMVTKSSASHILSILWYQYIVLVLFWWGHGSFCYSRQ